jgi:hypothetical protein
MIYTKFWYDNYISALSAKEKLLFIYLISNEKVNICGIYEMPDKYILLDTGLKQKELEIIKEKFMQDGKFAFIDGWVKIMNFDNYNSFSGELNDKAKEKELAIIPQEILDFIYPIDRVSNGYRKSIDSLININHNKYINNRGIIKGEKTKYLDNVFLLDEEYQKLFDSLGESKTKDMIEKLDLYIGSKGDKYKSHYKTILNWVRMEEDKNDTGIKTNYKKA